MAKFVYRLQNVLDLKIKMETQERTNFSLAAAELNAQETKLFELQELKKQKEEEYRKCSTGTLDVFELKFAKDNIEYAKMQIEEQKKNVERAKSDLEVARFRLNEAMKERKIHEKLKENAFEEFLAEENDAEKKEIDQLVSFRYNDKKEGDE